MGSLRMKDTEYKYKEIDRSLKQQFITRINNKAMTSEITEKLTSIKKYREGTSNQGLTLTKRIEVQRLKTIKKVQSKNRRND